MSAPALAWLPRSNGAGSSSGCPYAGYLDGCGGTYAPTIAGSYTTKITNFFTGYAQGNYAQSLWCGTSGDPNSVACLNMTSDGVAGNPAPYSIPSWTTNTGTRFPGTGTPSEIAGSQSDQQTIPYGYGGTGGYGSTNPFAESELILRPGTSRVLIISAVSTAVSSPRQLSSTRPI